MYLTPEQLRKLQLVENELICEVDRICKKNNIKYSLYAGTLLGAVRHKGFIPWDDDADICFFPEEYEKFYEACKNDLGEKFFLQDYRTDPHYRWGYAKLRRNNSEFVREGQEHMKYHNGICIDLFCLFSVPDNKLAREIYYLKFFLIRKTLYSEVGRLSEKNAFKRAVYSLLSKISKEKVFKYANRIIYRKPSELVNLMYIPNAKSCKYGIPRRCLEENTELEFEGKKLSAMSGYDEVLGMAYGDYMKLPPEDDRESHNPASKIVFPDD
ncbi:MAG: LicD family protein [Lachnospiraceae bacterium]|nr:LicD family protein [Lachnospiraceae bacterium]